MKKTFAITFSISVLVLFSIAIIVFMLMLPQKSQVASGSVNEYEKITKSEYTYESTKDITVDSLTHEYVITSEDIARFKKNHQYKPGNSDPFTAKEEPSSGNGTGNGGTNNGSGSASDKTENGNGGVPLPPATSK